MYSILNLCCKSSRTSCIDDCHCDPLQASEREIIWVMRAAIIGVGILATVMGITITSIYGLWFLCADLVYVILFPQLVCVVYLKGTNTYGSLSGYLMGLMFRLLGGEPLVGLPPGIQYPGYTEEFGQKFPFRTLSMIISFSTILLVSYPARYIFENGLLPKHYDVFQCIVNIPEEVIALKEPDERGEMTIIHAKKGMHDAASSGNGEINPALKFSKSDLLDASPIEPGEGSSLTRTPSP